MHPRTFLDSFWRNDLTNEVFVAMAINDRTQARWETIFRPAIEAEPIGGLSLRARRTDISKTGDSILTEIADGVGHAQLVMADVSVVDRWVENGQERFARNANVLYEVGLALACRQPVEVVLVRDDDDALLFDVTTIPTTHFDPDDVVTSAGIIRSLLNDRLAERALQADLRVQGTLESLSQFELNVIRQNRHLQVLSWSGSSLPAAVAMALPGLLQRRILRLALPLDPSGIARYEWTTFGRVIVELLPPGNAA